MNCLTQQTRGISFSGLEHDLSKLMKKKENVIDQLGQGVHSLLRRKAYS